MLLTLEQFIAKGKLSLPDVLHGIPGAQSMHFLPVMAYPQGIFLSSSNFVEDRPSRDENVVPRVPSSYAEERKIINLDFAYSQSDGSSTTMNSLQWAIAQEHGGYTLLSHSSEIGYFHDEAEAIISAYALYLQRVGVDKTTTAPVVDLVLKLNDYPSFAFIRSSAMSFAGVSETVSVESLDDLVDRLETFCEPPNWSDRGTRPYADLRRISRALIKFMRRNCDASVLENIDEAVAMGMAPPDALKRVGRALRSKAFRNGDAFDAIACVANFYGGQALVDADVPPSPQQRAVFLAAIERAAETGFSFASSNINLAKRRIAKLRKYEELIENKARRLSDGEITYAHAMETLRQLVNVERAANDNPDGQDAAELIDAATSFKVALALGRRFAQEVHDEIVADFAASLPDIHMLLAAIRSSDFPADLEDKVEHRFEADSLARGFE